MKRKDVQEAGETLAESLESKAQLLTDRAKKAWREADEAARAAETADQAAFTAWREADAAAARQAAAEAEPVKKMSTWRKNIYYPRYVKDLEAIKSPSGKQLYKVSPGKIEVLFEGRYSFYLFLSKRNLEKLLAEHGVLTLYY
jgi:hypothetical protein